jgi:hypothetical protein
MLLDEICLFLGPSISTKRISVTTHCRRAIWPNSVGRSERVTGKSLRKERIQETLISSPRRWIRKFSTPVVWFRAATCLRHAGSAAAHENAPGGD